MPFVGVTPGAIYGLYRRIILGVTALTFGQTRRRLGLTQAAFAALLATTANSVARMERGEQAIRPPMARLVLLVAYLADRGDSFAAELAAKARKGRRRK